MPNDALAARFAVPSKAASLAGVDAPATSSAVNGVHTPAEAALNGGHASLDPALAAANGAGPDAAADAELEPVDVDLVPLGIIVERIVGHAYTELANLTEVLPAMDDAARKRAIVDYVLGARRELVKLLVLGRWSRHSQAIRKGMSIINFLAGQNFLVDEAIRELQQTRAMLAGARVRNYDLVTAVDVLTLGTYTRLPSSIREEMATDERLANAEVLRTLHQLNAVIRYRLAVEDVLPPALHEYTVADGRATFRAGAYEAAVTLGGQNEDDRWFLLSVRLDEAEDTDAQVAPALRDRMVEIGNEVLTPIAPTDPARRDAPLVRLHEFLSRLALNRRLEALHVRAQLMARTRWTRNLRVELSKTESTLTLSYWIAPPPPPPAVPGRAPAAPVTRPPSKLRLSVESAQATGSSESILRGLTLYDDAPAAEADDGHLSLAVHWEPPPSVAVSDADKRREAPIDSDVESILSHATRQHADAILRKLSADLDAARSSFVVEPQQGIDGLLSSLLVKLHGTCFVSIVINELSGLTEFAVAGDEASAAFEARLQAASGPLNDGRGSLVRVLTQLRTDVIRAEIETAALHARLELARLPAPQPSDLHRLGANLQAIMHVRMPGDPRFHLGIAISATGLGLMLVSYTHTGTTVAIADLAWLTLAEPAASPFELTSSALAELHRYASVRLALLTFEDALHRRHIAFESVPSPAQLPPSARTAAAPLVLVQLHDFVQGPATFPRGQLVVRAVPASTPRPATLALGVRLERTNAAALTDLELPADATLHDSGLISLTIADVDARDVLEPVLELLTSLAELYKPKLAVA